MLVFVAGHAPILGTQSLYFRDPVFLERAQLPVPTTTAFIAARFRHSSSQRPPPRTHPPDRAGAAASCSMLLAGGLGFRLNETPSVPVGLWRVSAVAVLERGRVVVSARQRPTSFSKRAGAVTLSAECPSALEPMLKVLAGCRATRCGKRPRRSSSTGALFRIRKRSRRTLKAVRFRRLRAAAS